MWTELLMAGAGLWLLGRKKQAETASPPSEPPSTSPAPTMGKQGTPLAGVSTGAIGGGTTASKTTPTVTSGTPASSLATVSQAVSTAGALASVASKVTTGSAVTPGTIVPPTTQASSTLKIATGDAGSTASALALPVAKPAGWWTAPDPGVAGMTTIGIGSQIEEYRRKWQMWLNSGMKAGSIPTGYPFSAEVLTGKLSKEEMLKAEKVARDQFEIAYNAGMGRVLASATTGSVRLGTK